MTRLHDLYEAQGQSPWLDNLSRGHLTEGRLTQLVDRGIRGVTANPTILARAITGSAAYDSQLAHLVRDGRSVEDAWWQLVIDDVTQALDLLLPLHQRSGRTDGFVSLEVAPELAYDSAASVAAAAELHRRIDRPNLLVKIPATVEGVDAIRRATAAGHNINVTLLFSLERYAQVIEAYLSGLEAYAAAGGDLAAVHSVASFFVSRVDAEVDRRLAGIGAKDAPRLRGRAAIAQAKLAYQLFREAFAGPRWDALATHGARVQRPLWASTSTKDPTDPDTRYVDALIGPDTITTLPETTIAAFTDHGTVRRSIDEGIDEAADVVARLADIDIDLGKVGEVLEEQGVATFAKSISELLDTLAAKTRHLTTR
jgi:transaldolase